MNIWVGRAIIFVIAGSLGAVLAKFHIPIPFVLGGMITAMCSKVFFGRFGIDWPKKLREIALLVAGYGIGSNFDITAWNNLLSQTVGILGSTFISIAACLFLAVIIAKITKEDMQSCCIGFLPGGMTVAMLMCDDDDSIEPNVVMVMQIIRLFAVVMFVPFLVVYLLDAQVTSTGITMTNKGGFHWLIFVPLSIMGAFIGEKIHLPTPRLLGPVIATAIFSVSCGNVQAVPAYVMAPAQLSIGLFMGMLMDPVKISKIKSVFVLTVIASAIILEVSYITAAWFAGWYGFTAITGFLAMAPGGIAEMALAGMSMGEDVSIILSYQLIRLIIMNAVLPYFLVWCFQRIKKQA
ncbi:MAG: AbrB family transcriptional regulator [Phascolarctobacterium sp.]|nr:AbrB family transcriptional regulator [Phascolarctobacterium sp.]